MSCLADKILSARKKLAQRRPPVAAIIEKPAPVPEKTVVAAHSTPWYRQWWFWTVVGGVVAAGCGVGLGYLLQPDKSDSGYRVIVTRPGE